MKKPRVAKEGIQPTYSFMWWRGGQWEKDNGGYGNTMYGVARAVFDLFGPDNEIMVKVADGAKYMGEIDNTLPWAVPSDIASASKITSAITSAGVDVRFWAVPLGMSNWQTEVHKLISICVETDPAPAGLVLDIEPYRGFWNTKHPAGFAKVYASRLSGGLNNHQPLWMSSDVRGTKLSEIRWSEWEPHIGALLAQCYWQAFKRPAIESLQICEASMAKAQTLSAQLAMTLPWYEQGGQRPTTDSVKNAIQWCINRNYPISFFVIQGYTMLKQLAAITNEAEDAQ